mmetsp:Transcript_23236/g.50246  ORF Transcript_23236/g.50246 Transcript_23236/m.50246 type:complete len:406 (-) Transcript_23236:622-1839(-)
MIYEVANDWSQDAEVIKGKARGLFSSSRIWVEIEEGQGEEGLELFLTRCASVQLGKQSVKVHLAALKKGLDKESKVVIDRIYSALYVLVLEARQLREPGVHDEHNAAANAQLLARYTQLLDDMGNCEGSEGSEEEAALRRFAYYMCLLLQLFPAKDNKGRLMHLAGLLSGKVVITGGGQTAETKRRVVIYEVLGGSVAVKDPRQKKRKAAEEAAEAEAAAQTGTSGQGPLTPHLSPVDKRARTQMQQMQEQMQGMQMQGQIQQWYMSEQVYFQSLAHSPSTYFQQPQHPHSDCDWDVLAACWSEPLACLIPEPLSPTAQHPQASLPCDTEPFDCDAQFKQKLQGIERPGRTHSPLDKTAPAHTAPTEPPPRPTHFSRASSMELGSVFEDLYSELNDFVLNDFPGE